MVRASRLEAKCRKTAAGSTSPAKARSGLQISLSAWRAALSPEEPVLIAGPTASGKSRLAMEIAAAQGGVIVNADALQVYRAWRILTARPSAAEEAALPHRLYGHIGREVPYSVGDWLRQVQAILAEGVRPIIIGGTGLYFTALTKGLAPIPAIPPAVRAAVTAEMAAEGPLALWGRLDPATQNRTDRLNPARVQRALEVARATGRGLSAWQAETPPPLLPLDKAAALLLWPDKEALAGRIAARLQEMITEGVLDEVAANAPFYAPRAPWAQAIGAKEFLAHLRGEIALAAALEAAASATRAYAKRQRTYFRGHLKAWPVCAL